MKTRSAALVAILLAVAVCAVAQVSFPNKIASAQAVTIVSRLPLGMDEHEMYGFLATNGLKWVYTADIRPPRVYPDGTSLADLEKDLAVPDTNVAPEALCSYALSDGGRLRLRVSAKSDTVTNRVLREAFLEKAGGGIVSITLTNRP